MKYIEDDLHLLNVVVGRDFEGQHIYYLYFDGPKHLYTVPNVIMPGYEELHSDPRLSFRGQFGRDGFWRNRLCFIWTTVRDHEAVVIEYTLRYG